MNTVRVTWEQNGGHWNETCAWVLEHFGLPGHRFKTEVNSTYMDFNFDDEQDALLCAIGCGGQILVDQ